MTYRGKRMCFRMASESAGDYDSFVPDRGVTRNFRWQLSGEIPNYEGEYFGAHLRVFGPWDPPAGSKLVFTMIPDGPLVDGSVGQTLTLEADGAFVQGIPVGVYRVSAAYVAADGARTPLEVSRAGGDDYASEAVVQWETDGSCVGSTGSGVDRGFFYIRVPESE